MKKTYMEPAFEVVKIETAHMLAASVEGFNELLNSDGVDGSNALAPELFGGEDLDMMVIGD